MATRCLASPGIRQVSGPFASNTWRHDQWKFDQSGTNCRSSRGIERSASRDFSSEYVLQEGSGRTSLKTEASCVSSEVALEGLIVPARWLRRNEKSQQFSRSSSWPPPVVQQKAITRPDDDANSQVSCLYDHLSEDRTKVSSPHDTSLLTRDRNEHTNSQDGDSFGHPVTFRGKIVHQ